MSLSRQDQYMLLLTTDEWLNFRRICLDAAAHKCSACGINEGPLEIEIPEVEWNKILDKYQEELNRFNELKQRREENWPKILEYMRDGKWEEDIMKDVFTGMPNLPLRTRTIAETTLQVHHKLYFDNKLPWEYPMKYLEVLCRECHSQTHKSTKIYTYLDQTMRFRKEQISCKRCDGTGNIPEYYYRDHGICYTCGGTGFENYGTHQWVEV